MLYDGINPLHREQARQYLERLLKKGVVFELTEKKPKRTSSQNRYLHSILGYFGVQTGNTLDWVKEEYFKKLVNHDIFEREKDDRFLGRVKYLRSSADLDTAEMTTCIERFRNWSSINADIYLPSSEDERMIGLMEIEIERNKLFL